MSDLSIQTKSAPPDKAQKDNEVTQQEQQQQPMSPVNPQVLMAQQAMQGGQPVDPNMAQNGMMDPSQQMAQQAPQEPYGAQVLRRLHQDHMILMQEYDEMLNLLDHPEVKMHLVANLQNIEMLLQETEGIFAQFYGQLPGLDGSMSPDMGMSPDDPAIDGYDEKGPEPTPEEAYEGMENSREDRYGKSLRKKDMMPEEYEEEDMLDHVCPDCGEIPCECDEEVEEEEGDEMIKEGEDLIEDGEDELQEGEYYEDEADKMEGAYSFLSDLENADLLDEETKYLAFHHHKNLEPIGNIPHAGRKNIGVVSLFLKSIAHEKAFGDKHRKYAKNMADVLSKEMQGDVMNKEEGLDEEMETRSKAVDKTALDMILFNHPAENYPVMDDWADNDPRAETATEDLYAHGANANARRANIEPEDIEDTDDAIRHIMREQAEGTIAKRQGYDTTVPIPPTPLEKVRSSRRGSNRTLQHRNAPQNGPKMGDGTKSRKQMETRSKMAVDKNALDRITHAVANDDPSPYTTAERIIEEELNIPQNRRGFVQNFSHREDLERRHPNFKDTWNAASSVLDGQGVPEQQKAMRRRVKMAVDKIGADIATNEARERLEARGDTPQTHPLPHSSTAGKIVESMAKRGRQGHKIDEYDVSDTQEAIEKAAWQQVRKNSGADKKNLRKVKMAVDKRVLDEATTQAGNWENHLRETHPEIMESFLNDRYERRGNDVIDRRHLDPTSFADPGDPEYIEYPEEDMVQSDEDYADTKEAFTNIARQRGGKAPLPKKPKTPNVNGPVNTKQPTQTEFLGKKSFDMFELQKTLFEQESQLKSLAESLSVLTKNA